VRWPFFGSKQASGPIRLSLPETVDVGYLVYFRWVHADPPTAESLRSLAEPWLRKYTENPLQDGLLKMLGTSLVRLDVGARREMPEPPSQIVAAWGPGEEEQRRFAGATHSAMISVHDMLRPPRLGFWLALGMARAIAENTGGVVLDPLFPRLSAVELNHDPLPSNGEIRVGQQVMVPQSVGNKGLMWTTTKGLSRFGLPELETRDTPPNLGPAVAYVVNGAAQHLVRALLTEAFQSEQPLRELSIPPTLRVTLDDIVSARTMGELLPPPEDARGWIEVGLQYRPGGRNQDSFLRLSPLAAARDHPGVWWSTELTELFGAGESTLRLINSDSEAMDAAHLKATRELPAVRARYAAGLSPGEILSVKHGFPTSDGGHEYMWLVVTSWRGDRLRCTLMNQPEVRRDLRQGQRIDLRESDLFDWCLHLPDGGYEGGYTEEVVDREHA